VYFNVKFNVFFKLIKVHLLVSELYIHQNAWCNGGGDFKFYCRFIQPAIKFNFIQIKMYCMEIKV